MPIAFIPPMGTLSNRNAQVNSDNINNYAKDVENRFQIVDDFIAKMRKEMEFLLQNLDQDNMNEVYIKRLKADFIKAQEIVTQRLIAEYIQSDFILTNTVITNNLYADSGYIARLTVDSLLTSDVLQDFDTMHYIDMQDNYITFIKGIKNNNPKIQYQNSDSEPLYYKYSEDYGRDIITTEDTGRPVMVSQYDLYEKLKVYYESDESVDSPVIVMGTGNLKTHGLFMEQQAVIRKDDTGLKVTYIQDGGNELSIELGESGVKINGSPYHKITAGTAAPTGGQDGDIYFRYAE